MVCDLVLGSPENGFRLILGGVSTKGEYCFVLQGTGLALPVLEAGE